MRIFVAGATGVVGERLVPRLVGAGYAVTGMTRSPAKAERLRQQGAEAVLCDAFDRDALREAVVAVRPEAVVHERTDLPEALELRKMASQLEGTARLRREGTQNLVDDDPAPLAEWLPAYAEALGAPRPRHLLKLLVRLMAGPYATELMTEARGASNAKAKRELGWEPRHPSWRAGFAGDPTA